jgi:ribosomal protein S3
MELNENSYLRKGNRIGYLRSNEYLEEVVSSMQIEGLDVEKAESGQRVGIKTIYPGIVLKEGMDVYSIN